jgi:hypothetical protein
MDETIVREMLPGLFSCFEALDTQSTAVLQLLLLKDTGIANEWPMTMIKTLPPIGNKPGTRAAFAGWPCG